MTRRMSHYRIADHDEIDGICDATRCTPIDVAVWPAENGGECPTCLDRYEATEPVVTIDGHRHHARCAP